MASRILPRPKRQIIVVPRSAANIRVSKLNNTARWVFGPGTKFKWPSGDFVDKEWHSESAWQFAELIARPDVMIYDPDMQMDIGL